MLNTISDSLAFLSLFLIARRQIFRQITNRVNRTLVVLSRARCSIFLRLIRGNRHFKNTFLFVLFLDTLFFCNFYFFLGHLYFFLCGSFLALACPAKEARHTRTHIRETLRSWILRWFQRCILIDCRVQHTKSLNRAVSSVFVPCGELSASFGHHISHTFIIESFLDWFPVALAVIWKLLAASQDSLLRSLSCLSYAALFHKSSTFLVQGCSWLSQVRASLHGVILCGLRELSGRLSELLGWLSELLACLLQILLSENIL